MVYVSIFFEIDNPTSNPNFLNIQLISQGCQIFFIPAPLISIVRDSEVPAMVIKLSDAFKLSGADHDKIISPETTLETFMERSKQACLTILEETRRIDNNRLGIPVYFSVCGHDAHRLTGTKKQMGKGVTPALAEASAVMELAERFSLYSFLDNPANVITATYDEVQDRAIPFEAIAMSVHEPEHLPRDISRRVFSSIPFKWTSGLNVTQNKEVLVPIDWFFMISEFNGSSAGNCNEEAVCQGICELVERHVSSIIAKKRPALHHIRPESVLDPSNTDMIRKYQSEGIKLCITDFSLDTGIPTIGILAWDPETFPENSEIVWTAGTAPSPEKALSRALTEVAQLAGDFNTGSSYVASGLPKFKTLDEASFIIKPLEDGTALFRNLSDLPDVSNRNIREEIMTMAREMTRLGFDIITIDTTDPRLKIPAFYSIIPGAAFRERAENSSVAMFVARHAVDTLTPDRALSVLEFMDRLCPETYFLKFYQGLALLSLGLTEKALVLFQAAMNLDPARQDIPSICSYAGVCLKDLGDYRKALEILNRGIECDPEREDIYNLMGYCLFMLKQHQESIGCFQKVLELNPGSGIDHASLASNYRELGNIEKAVHHYEMALILDPSLDFARKNLEKLDMR